MLHSRAMIMHSSEFYERQKLHCLVWQVVCAVSVDSVTKCFVCFLSLLTTCLQTVVHLVQRHLTESRAQFFVNHRVVCFGQGPRLVSVGRSWVFGGWCPYSKAWMSNWDQIVKLPQFC